MTIRALLDELLALERYHVSSLKRIKALREKIVAECSETPKPKAKRVKLCQPETSSSRPSGF